MRVSLATRAGSHQPTLRLNSQMESQRQAHLTRKGQLEELLAQLG